MITPSFVFEGTLDKASSFRKIIEAIKELVKDVNFQINQTGMSLQAMDTSHVALVSAIIKAEGFTAFSCSKQITIGVNLEHMIKVMKLAEEDDNMTLKADESGDKLYMSFENASNILSVYPTRNREFSQSSVLHELTQH